MSAYVLLVVFNEFYPSFRNEFNKFNNTRARMLNSVYHTLNSHFWRKTS